MVANRLRKLGRAAGNVAISLVAILLTLALLEIGLRLIIPGPVVIGYLSLWSPDRILGWRLKPDGHLGVWSAHQVIQVSTNSHGWRDHEHAIPKPEGVFRVLVLGDSFMEGHAVSDEDTFARQLEAVARQAGLENIDVMNMGVEGYGTLQSYLAYVKEGVRYEPDLVLLGFYVGNDVHDNYRPLEVALWGEDSYPVVGRPFLESWDQSEWEIVGPDYDRALALSNQRTKWSQWQKSRLLSVLARALVIYWDEQEGLNRGGEGATDDNIWLGSHLCEETPQFTEGWAVTERILVELDGAVRESGAHLIVFTVPSHEETDPAYAERVADTLEDPEGLCLEEGLANERILGILERNGIPGIDLLPSFRSALREEGRELFAQDNHWNAEGYTLATEEVFESLSAEGFLPGH